MKISTEEAGAHGAEHRITAGACSAGRQTLYGLHFYASKLSHLAQIVSESDSAALHPGYKLYAPCVFSAVNSFCFLFRAPESLLIL
jgi:hypothetical protein